MKKVILGGVVMASALVLASCGQKVDSPLDTMEKAPDAMVQKQVESDAMMVKESDAMMEKDDTMMQQDDSAMMKKDDAMVKHGAYTSYSASAVDTALKSGKKVVLFFHASWCPSCKSADASLSKAMLDENIALFKTDYDTNVDLRKKYGVTSQHTFVSLNADGSLKTKASGLSTAEEIAKL